MAWDEDALHAEIAEEFESFSSGVSGANAIRNWDFVFPGNGIAKGERVHTARLTAERVMQIRREYGWKGETTLAREFGVSIVCIHQIVTRKTWTHIPVETAQQELL